MMPLSDVGNLHLVQALGARAVGLPRGRGGLGDGGYHALVQGRRG